MDGLAYRLSQSLAGAGNHAAYAWTRDSDGALRNAADQELFFIEYTDGVWGSPRQFTTNKLYELQRASVATGPYAPLASHILSTPPVNTYLDTTATNASQFFYRLRVE